MRRHGLIGIVLLLGSLAVLEAVTVNAELTIAGTAVALPATVVTPNGVPTTRCLLRSSGTSGEYSYTVDGTTATASHGVLVEALDVLTLDSPEQIGKFQGIRTGATSATVSIVCDRP